MSLMDKFCSLGGPGKMYVSVVDWGDIISHVRRLEPVVARATTRNRDVAVIKTEAGFEIFIDGELRMTICD